tara:strand:- start:1246 stop:1425 length:180 start_codon:yes stop_codon:yes gene_type:complete
VQQAHKVLAGQPVLQVMMGQQALLVKKELLVLQAQQAQQAHKALLVTMVQTVLKVKKVK